MINIIHDHTPKQVTILPVKIADYNGNSTIEAAYQGILYAMEMKADIMSNPLYAPAFSVEEVNRRTLAGMPFRDAYKSVGIEVNEGKFRYQGAEGKTNGQLTPADLKHSSMGSLGNLCNEQIKVKMEKAANM